MLTSKTVIKSVRPTGAALAPRPVFSSRAQRSITFVRAEVDTKPGAPSTSKPEDPASTTEKYGLEAGLFKVFTGKSAEGEPSKTDQAKQLLAQYGSAYLITSISFAIVSFGLCYTAVTAGVDMGSLLKNIGLEVNNTSEAVGNFAIAYAAHKALSPVRFPPTVALTPVVAKFLGKKKE